MLPLKGELMANALEHNHLSSERCINYDRLVNSLAYEQSPRLYHWRPGLTHRPRALLVRAMGGLVWEYPVFHTVPLGAFMLLLVRIQLKSHSSWEAVLQVTPSHTKGGERVGGREGREGMEKMRGLGREQGGVGVVP